MKLYSLRRVADGKYFVHTNGLGHLVMNSTPIFWKTPDSIWVNLKRVCSDFAPYADPHFPHWQKKGWANFDPTKLTQWEVVVTTVNVLKQKCYPAPEFVDIAKLNEIDTRLRAA